MICRYLYLTGGGQVSVKMIYVRSGKRSALPQIENTVEHKGSTSLQPVNTECICNRVSKHEILRARLFKAEIHEKFFVS